MPYSLYHYERKLGTTTFRSMSFLSSSLYHYERKLGTTTPVHAVQTVGLLYHYERNWELRLMRAISSRPIQYTTTRENWELRRRIARCPWQYDYTTTRENWELRQCDHIEEINFHHIVILAAAGSCAREGRIEHKKENTGTSSEHGGKSLHRLHPKHHSALMFPFIIFYHRRAASRHPEVLIVDLTFSLLFSFFCLWRWRFMV